MGRYSYIILDRDCAFDVNSLNELLTQGKAILNEAIEISEKIGDSISNISGIYKGIDRGYRFIPLEADLADIPKRIKMKLYQDTIDRMEEMLNKLMDEIPSCDNSLAKEMNNVQEVLYAVKSRIGELKRLLNTTDVGWDYNEFSQRLEDIKAGWDITTEDLAGTLAEIENNMLGVSAAAVQYSKDPVNLSTGNFVYDHEDMKIGGEIPLSFHRYYNSKDRRKGCLGRCFLHNYDSRLENNEEKGKVTVSMEDGRKKTFRKMEDGTYSSLYSATETLTREKGRDEKGAESQEENKTEQGEENREQCAVQKECRVLTELSGKRTVYDASGQMIRQENRYGRGITFSYDEAGRLIKAETDNHTYFIYSYDEAGQLVCVTDHTGRKVELSYTRGKLAEVKVPSESIYTYRYAKNGRIEEVVNSRGSIAVKNIYDEKRRVIRQEFPDGGHMEFAYDDNKKQVILTERNGSKTVYLHDSRYRNTDILYEDGTKEHFGYNNKNQRILHTDRNGNTTRMAYDNRGNLTQVINALGEKANLTYNAFNQLTVLKVNGKEKLRNSYDRHGNLISSVGADGTGNRLSYDGQGRPVSIEDADKSVTKLTYDDRGNIRSIQDAGGTEINYRYDSLNHVCQTTDGNGNITLFEYDDADRIKKVTNPLGDSRIYSYNESGKVTKVTDYDGFSIQAEYNSLNKPQTVTDKEGNITHFSYDKMWNISKLQQANGGVHTYEYDIDNRLKKEHFPEGGFITYTYDGNGNRISETDREGNETSYVYDAMNRMIEEQKPDETVTCYKYDPEGNLEKITDALGNSICYTYDCTGKRTSETDALGNKTAFKYTPAGKTAEVIYPNGTVERYIYRNGLLERVYKANGERVQYKYDRNGNIISVIDGTGEEIRYSYDALNRMISQATAEGTRLFEYDSIGNLRLLTDENGNTTKYEYSPNGNLSKVTDALGNETHYSYDCMGNLIKIEQTGEMSCSTAEEKTAGRNGKQVTIYERNLEGRIVKSIDPAGYAEYYTYDKNGRITEKQDKDNFCTVYRYGKTGDLSEILYGDGRSVLFSYDALHHLETIKDWGGTTKIITDALGRTLSVTEPDGKTVSYEWGAGNEKKTLTYPDGRKAKYSYNDRGLLERLTTGKGTVKYEYDESGRLRKKELPNGIVTSYAYGRQGRIGQIRHEGAEFSESYKYSYDAAGNKILVEKSRSGMKEDQGCFAYQYDALNRLIQVKKDEEQLREYEYDPFGNRMVKREYTDGVERTTRYSYNEKNQLLSETDKETERSYQYDLRGNMTGVTVNGKQIKQFIFDAANRMSFSAEATDDFIKKAEYRYNGLGQRIGQDIRRAEKESTDIAGALINIPMSEMPEEKVNYTLDPTRIYYNMLCLETGNKWQNFYWDGNVVSMEEGEAESYYVHDDLGSPACLLDEAGCSREVYGYDEFGADLSQKSGDSFCRQVQPFGFTGYQMEEAGGVYYAQARRYDAGIGRFISEDFIKGFTTAPYTLNHYGYCWNRPLDLVDLDGRLSTGAKLLLTAAMVAAITVLAVVAAPVAASVVVATTVGGALIGGVGGGLSNVNTLSGSFVNGFAGGAVNGAISVGGAFSISPYISNGIGGSAGSWITDLLNNADREEEDRKSLAEMSYSARVAGGTQFILGGAFASLWTWQTGGMNIANTVGMDRLTTALWDIFTAGGSSYASGTISSIYASETWKVYSDNAMKE